MSPPVAALVRNFVESIKVRRKEGDDVVSVSTKFHFLQAGNLRSHISNIFVDDVTFFRITETTDILGLHIRVV